MSHLEEQQEERDVLASIFPDELTDISESSYSILIKLDLPASISGGDEDGEPPSLLLTIALPPTYPAVPPSLTLSFPPTPTSIRPPHLHPPDFPPLLSALDPTIAESLGTAMIFTLHSSLKESIESLIQSRVDAIADAEEDVKRRQQEEEDRKFAGERVTRAGFLAWREGFLREMGEMEEERVREEGMGKGGKGKGGVGVEEEGKMTGRMLWERGMVGRGGEEEEEGEGL